jgi:hypothetical protein
MMFFVETLIYGLFMQQKKINMKKTLMFLEAQ